MPQWFREKVFLDAAGRTSLVLVPHHETLSGVRSLLDRGISGWGGKAQYSSTTGAGPDFGILRS